MRNLNDYVQRFSDSLSHRLDQRVNKDPKKINTSFLNRFVVVLGTELIVALTIPKRVIQTATAYFHIIHPVSKPKGPVGADGCYTFKGKQWHASHFEESDKLKERVKKAVKSTVATSLLVPIGVGFGLTILPIYYAACPKRGVRIADQTTKFDKFCRDHKELSKGEIDFAKTLFQEWLKEISPIPKFGGKISASEISNSYFFKNDAELLEKIKAKNDPSV